jgi:hypothetical protein
MRSGYVHSHNASDKNVGSYISWVSPSVKLLLIHWTLEIQNYLTISIVVKHSLVCEVLCAQRAMYVTLIFLFFCLAQQPPPPPWTRASSFSMFLDHTQRRTTVAMTPLDEWSARSRDLYLTTHNNHNRQTSMPLVGFEPTISAGEQAQTYAWDRAATGTGEVRNIGLNLFPVRHASIKSNN